MNDFVNDYTPKKGDRVRVVVEGEVTEAQELGPQVLIAAEYDRVHTVWYRRKGVSIERLPDPEPQWQVGYVVKVSPYYPFLRTFDGWVSANDAGLAPGRIDCIVSEAWANGTLQILHDPSEES